MTSETFDASASPELANLLSMEEIYPDTFEGGSYDMGFGNVFGGQIVAQSMLAATQTVPEDRLIHSLHGYFLRAGDTKDKFRFEVERIRDGRSFSTRRVMAVQKERPVFCLSASFFKPEAGFEHQADMPADIPAPEALTSDLAFTRSISDQIPEPFRSRLIRERLIEIRQAHPVNPLKPVKKKPFRCSWFRATTDLPDTQFLHRALLAYASDFGLLVTSLYPHGKTFWNPKMHAASLDHAVWFHRDINLADWHLYVMESPNAAGGTGLNFGKVYTRDGRLVASTAQDGLIRYTATQQK